jgi:GAF domain-containing protein
VPNIDRAVLQSALGKVATFSPTRPLEDTLGDVVDAAASVFAVSGTGLMFIDDTDALRHVASSDEASRVLEEAQEELGLGPCVDSLVLDTLIATTDIANDPRWPGLAAKVVPAGVRSVLGVPVRVGAGAVGSLDAYSDTPHDWDESETEALQRFAELVQDVVASALFAHQQGVLAQQLQHALDHRVAIERAIGLLMGRAGDVDAVAAFNRLRSFARAERRRVGDVAVDVLNGIVEV